MNVTLKTPHYRIEHPHSGLAIKFTNVAAPLVAAPKITAGLVNPEKATIFATFDHAAACFAAYLAGHPLEIVRVDA